MIKEYYVVARYLAKTVDEKNPIETIYNRLESDLNKIIKFDRQNEIRQMFTVVEGNEITEEEYENE